MRLGARLLLFGLALGVGAYACAYPEFEFRPEGTPSGSGALGGSGGDGASTSTGGFGGTGGSGGSTTSTGGSGGSGARGGTGGTGSMVCMPWVTGQCEDGDKCTVLDVQTGATGCATAGQQPSWSKCLNNNECSDGDWCDATTQTCKPVCNSGADCLVSAQCIQAKSAANADIPGLKVCTSYCHPENAGPCNQGYGPTTCVYRAAEGYGLDCWASGGADRRDDCAVSQDCGVGLACTDVCRPWCSPPRPVAVSDCGAFKSCRGLSPELHYGGDEWGICDPW